MTDTQVTTKQGQSVPKDQKPQTETIHVPDVDISEDNECFRLVADMPGVDQSSVDVTVEKNVLSVEGWARLDAPKGYELVGREYSMGRYRRDFTLSNAVDSEGIKARVRHGVLEVTIPKREKVKSRKIEIGS